MTTTPELTPGAPQPQPYGAPQVTGAPRPGVLPRPGGFRPGGGSGFRPGGPAGPRTAGGQRPGPAGVRPRGRYGPRRRVCSFCVEHVKGIDYKDVDRIRRFISDRAKIEPTRKTGVCAKHQRLLSTAIKRARHLALLPFVPNPSLIGMGGYRR